VERAGSAVELRPAPKARSAAHPQERQHSAAEGGTRDRVRPAAALRERRARRPASGIVTRRAETLLAGKAVGAPFVGAAAATLVIAELLRLLHGGPVHELIDLDLKFPEYRSAVLTQHDFSALNPGYALAQTDCGQ
jgi:hypothetical protein